MYIEGCFKLSSDYSGALPYIFGWCKTTLGVVWNFVHRIYDGFRAIKSDMYIDDNRGGRKVVCTKQKLQNVATIRGVSLMPKDIRSTFIL